LTVLIATSSVKKASEISSASLPSIYNWLHEPAFYAAYQAGRQERLQDILALDETFATLKSHAPEAAETIVAIMRNEKAAAQTRLQACNLILDLSIVKSFDFDGSREKLEQLGLMVAQLIAEKAQSCNA